MQLNEAQYQRIAHCFPKARGKLRYSNLHVLNAILYITENGAKWRRLPAHYGRWHTIYSRMRHWAQTGVLARVFETLQREQLIRLKIESASLDATSIKVHPDGTGALKKTAPKPSDVRVEGSPPSFIWLPVMSAPRSASPSRPAKTRTVPKDESC